MTHDLVVNKRCKHLGLKESWEEGQVGLGLIWQEGCLVQPKGSNQWGREHDIPDQKQQYVEGLKWDNSMKPPKLLWKLQLQPFSPLLTHKSSDFLRAWFSQPWYLTTHTPFPRERVLPSTAKQNINKGGHWLEVNHCSDLHLSNHCSDSPLDFSSSSCN